MYCLRINMADNAENGWIDVITSAKHIGLAKHAHKYTKSVQMEKFTKKFFAYIVMYIVVTYLNNAVHHLHFQVNLPCSVSRVLFHVLSFTCSVSRAQFHLLCFTCSVSRAQFHVLCFTCSVSRALLHGTI